MQRIICRGHLLISTRRTVYMPTGYSNNSFSGYCIGGWGPRFINFFNVSTHFHKWGSEERPALDNIGSHDIIIDHNINEFAIRGQVNCFHFTTVYRYHMFIVRVYVNKSSLSWFCFWFTRHQWIIGGNTGNSDPWANNLQTNYLYVFVRFPKIILPLKSN